MRDLPMSSEERRSFQPDDPEEVRAFRRELDAAERNALRRVDLGFTAVLVSVGIVVLLLAFSLPWVEDANGLEVLQGDSPGPHQALGRLFAGVLIAFGLVTSGLALLTRRWALVWISAFGCGYSMLDGVWAIWSRQTGDGAGPRVGMVLAEFAVAFLFLLWIRFAWSRR